MSSPFHLIEPSNTVLPFVVGIPHCGTTMPEGIAERLAPGMDAQPMCDWHLHELYSMLPQLGITVIHAEYSRFVADLDLTDPPRAGMSAELRRRIAGWHPRRLFMMACDPATWARDTSFFLARGYGLRHLELVDLFPYTHHVEVLAMLESE